MPRKREKRSPVVRGPQLALIASEKLGWKERQRYAEPPSKRDGNPFFALRVPPAMLRLMLAKATKKKQYRTEWARAVLAKACGFKLEVANADS